MAYIKPLSPIKSGEDFIYPLTSYDQIIMDDGSRWDGTIVGSNTVRVDLEDAEEGTPALTNADMLGGKLASEYVLKEESGSIKSMTKEEFEELSNEEISELYESGTNIIFVEGETEQQQQGITMELLWENASPESEFAEQEFTIAGAENYELFLLITNQTSEIFMFDDRHRSVTMAAVWGTGQNHDISSRIYQAKSTFSIKFSNAMTAFTGANGAVSNILHVPLKIYGIKGVS